jgi:hypothetical protein
LVLPLASVASLGKAKTMKITGHGKRGPPRLRRKMEGCALRVQSFEINLSFAVQSAEFKLSF